MEKYYNIKYKNKPKACGIVVRVKENKLEIFAGVKQDILEFGVSLDNKGNLKVGKNYFSNLIDKKKAQEIKSQFDWHNGMQTIFSGTGYTRASHHLVGQNREALY